MPYKTSAQIQLLKLLMTSGFTLGKVSPIPNQSLLQPMYYKGDVRPHKICMHIGQFKLQNMQFARGPQIIHFFPAFGFRSLSL